jgi:hypothetical protein
MARYKVLPSVAHNFAHSFVSLMNYVGRDYVMCHLIRRVKLTGTRRFHFDVLRRTLGPVELLSPPILKSCEGYAKDFGRLVTSSGAALDSINSAELDLQVSLGRTLPRTAKLHGRVTATMRILDDRGREHVGRAAEEYDTSPLR